MKRGKRICKTLKELRKRIADANGIPYEIEDCPHKGPCPGTCPRCEAEVRYLERALAEKRERGEEVTIDGLMTEEELTLLANSQCGIDDASELRPLNGDAMPLPRDAAPDEEFELPAGLVIPEGVKPDGDLELLGSVDNIRDVPDADDVDVEHMGQVDGIKDVPDADDDADDDDVEVMGQVKRGNPIPSKP